MRVHATGKAGKEGADQEGGDLVARGVDAHGLGRNLIVGDRDEATPVGGVHHGPHHVDAQRGQPVGPEQVGVAGDADHAARAAHGIDVLQHHADDFAETQRDDGQIVTP